MDDFLKRMFDTMKVQEKKHKDLADYLGITPQRVTDWKSGRIASYSKYMDKIAEYLGVSVDYLLTGKSSSPAFPGIAPVTRRRVPLLGEISCGKPIYAEEEHEYSVPLGSENEADFVLRAKGDSMIGAHIHDGDLVFFRSCETVDNGKIAIVVIGDEATLKRVYYAPERQQLILMPENPSYRPLVFVGAELEQVRIMGEALFVQSRLH
jgi:repressor LexA